MSLSQSQLESLVAPLSLKGLRQYDDKKRGDPCPLCKDPALGELADDGWAEGISMRSISEYLNLHGVRISRQRLTAHVYGEH